MDVLEQLKARFAKSGMHLTDEQVIALAERVSGSLDAYWAYCTEHDQMQDEPVLFDADHALAKSPKWTDIPTVTIAGVTHRYMDDQVITYDNH